MLASEKDILKEASETVYTLTQEEKIRLQCQAREDYYRTQNDVRIYYTRQLDKKDAEISKKDAEISQKNAEISQKNAEISQKNAEISQKKAEIEALKKQIEDLKNK